MNTTKEQNRRQALNRKRMLSSSTPFAINEAYNTLRTNLMFTIKGEKCPAYIITSSLPNEGKSLNTINLAISFAHMDKKTLIIDMDMRNPTIHQLFDLPLNHGVSEYLAGLDEAVEYKFTEIENLKIITAGRIPPNPADLLSGKSVSNLLKLVRDRFDYVFIDMPPIELVADAAILAKMVTGYLLVIKKDDSDVKFIEHTVNVLDQVEADIVGFILNCVNYKEQMKYKIYQNKK